MNTQGFEQQLPHQVFALLQSSKQSAFNDTYSMYADHVYSLSFHLVCDESLARDIMQSVFESLLVESQELSSPEQLGIWLKQKTINICQHYFKQVINPTNCQQQNPVIAQSSQNCLNARIEDLSETQRSIVYLHKVQNLKPKLPGEAQRIIKSHMKSNGFWQKISLFFASRNQGSVSE